MPRTAPRFQPIGSFLRFDHISRCDMAHSVGLGAGPMSVWCGAGGRTALSSFLPFSPLLLRRHLHHSASHFPTTATTTHSSSLSAAATLPTSHSTYDSLSPQQKQQVSLYIASLLEWNQRMNLTAVTEAAEVMTRHVDDSLAVLPPLENTYRANCGGSRSCDDGLSLVDVGSGAGLPGLILAVARPSWKLTLLESMRKRCTFLEHVVGVMGLSNVHVVCDRAENVGQCLDYREVFDVAVARAVAELRILAEYCLPLVRVGGLFVAAKGYDPQDEIKNAKSAAHLLGASMLESCEVESHGPYGQRTAVIYHKCRPTPRKYPRHPGTPAKTPL